MKIITKLFGFTFIVSVLSIANNYTYANCSVNDLYNLDFDTEQCMGMSKKVQQTVLSVEQSEGVGARVRRSVGRPELRNLDPFLMLDEFKGKQPAGFPDHPHRGFETVSYMLKGQFKHEDSKGHKGIIEEGDLQWMTAGKGIVHCEMPWGDVESQGLQLWVNLAKKDKMIEPQYQELKSTDIPVKIKDGVTVKVIAGESYGTQSKVYTRTPTLYLDFKLDHGAKDFDFIQCITSLEKFHQFD